MMPPFKREEIIAGAIRIASTAEREAFIAGACNGDATLKRQVEESVAAHFRSSHTPPASYGTESVSSEAPAGTKLWPTIALLLLLTSVVSTGAAVWAWRDASEARREATDANAEREDALKLKRDLKHASELAEGHRADAVRQRMEAVAAVKATQAALDDATAVVAFLQERVLSAGLPGGWASGAGKEVSLRKVIDTAESVIATTFAQRPAVEAQLREILGSTYFDLNEPKLAATQFARALTLWEAVAGPNDPHAITCRSKLAELSRRRSHG